MSTVEECTTEYTELMVEEEFSPENCLLHRLEAGFSTGLLNLLFLVLVFFLPLFFLPMTSEFYETNKQGLLASTVPLGLILLGRVGLKRGYIIGSAVDKILAFLLGIFVFSTIFSLSRHTSFFGYFGRFHGGLLSLLFYLGLFYITLNLVESFSEIKRIITGMVLAVQVLAFLGVWQFFELYIFPFGFTRLRSWTPLGSPTALGYLIAFTLPLSLTTLFSADLLSPVVFLGILVELFLLGLLKNWLAWGVALVGLLVFGVLGRGESARRLGLGRLTGLLSLLIFGLCLSTTSIRSRLLSEQLTPPPVEVTLPPKLSWAGVKGGLNNRPLIGNGPETFIYSFSRFKTPAINSTSFWNVRFSRPFNEVFYLLATVGVIGTIVYVWLWIKSGQLARAALNQIRDYPDEDRNLAFGVVGCLFAYLAHLLVYYTTTTSAVFFWVILAMILVISGERQTRSLLTDKLWARGLKTGTAILIVAFYFLYFGKFYRAEIAYGKSLRAFASNRIQEALRGITQAARLNSYSDVYQMGLSTVNLAAVQGSDQPEKLDQETVTKLLQAGINAAQRACRLNPANVQTWEHLAGFYRTLMRVDEGAGDWALLGFANAIKLDPLNPRLRENLGGFYFQLEKYPEAERAFRLAIKLKPDYILAHYNLSRTYRQEEKYEEAKRELNQVLVLLSENASARSSIEAQVEDLDRLILSEAENVAKEIEAQTELPLPSPLPLPEEIPLATPSGERRTFFPTPPSDVPEPPPPGG